MYTVWNQCENMEISSNIKLSDDDIFFKLWFNYICRSWISLWTMMKVAICCRSSPRTCKIVQLSSLRSFRGTITMYVKCTMISLCSVPWCNAHISCLRTSSECSVLCSVGVSWCAIFYRIISFYHRSSCCPSQFLIKILVSSICLCKTHIWTWGNVTK